MSQTIDQRVVEMRFDNQQFESGVKTSLSTLDKLKNASNLTGNIKIFDGLSKAANNLKLDGLSDSVQSVADRFSILEEIGIGALRRIGSQAVDTGERFLKAMSVDNVAAGWQKFGEKTTSVGTLVAQGYDQSEVEDQLERLNWFTDETSYNLTDMIGNISKFTATGQGLEDSATAMQGIALWAALSGQNASTASRAMYQLSQAMSLGALTTQDYKSIQNASMDTKEFREQAIQTAIALGKVKQVGTDIYQVIDSGKSFNFAEMFSSDALTRTRWLDTDVMMGTFEKYSSAVDTLYEAYQAADGELTTSQIIEALGDDLDQFGLKAFRAGQEARTWRDVVDSVQDAVSTGWMQTFEMIFGDYTEATRLFTDMANTLYGIFAESGNARNAMLADWKELGGRTELINALKYAIFDLMYAIEPVKQAFSTIFPPITAERLYELTVKFREFMQNAQLSASSFVAVKNIFEGFFSVLKFGINIVTAFAKGLSPLFDLLSRVGYVTLQVAGAIGSLVGAYVQYLEKSGFFVRITQTVANALISLGASIVYGVGKVFELISSFAQLVSLRAQVEAGAVSMDLWRTATEKAGVVASFLATALVTIGKVISTVVMVIAGAIIMFVDFARSIESVHDFFNKLRKAVPTLTPVFTVLEKVVNKVIYAFTHISETFAKVIKKIGEFKTSITNTVKTFTDWAKSVKSVGDALAPTKKAFDGWLDQHENIKKAVTLLNENLKIFGNTITSIGKKVLDTITNGDIKKLIGYIIAGIFVKKVLDLTGAFSSLAEGIEMIGSGVKGLSKFVKNIGLAAILLSLAVAVDAFARALKLLSEVPPADLEAAGNAIGTVALSATMLAGAIGLLIKFGGIKGATLFTATAGVLAIGIAALAYAFKQLGDIKLDGSVAQKLILIAALMAELIVATYVLGKYVKQLPKGATIILAFGIALELVVDALIRLVNMTPGKQVDEAFQMLSQVIFDLSILSVAMSRLKFSNAVGLLAVIGAIYILEDALWYVAKEGIPIRRVKEVKDKFLIIAGTLAGIMAAMAIVGKIGGLGAGAAGVGALAAAYAMRVLIDAMNDVASMQIDWTPETAARIILLITELMALMAITRLAGDNALKAGVAILAITVSLSMLAGLTAALSMLPDQNALGVATGCVVMLGVVEVLMATAMKIAKDSNPLVIGVMTAALAVLVAGLAVLTMIGDVTGMLASAVSMGIVMITLAVMFKSVTNLTNKISFTSILTMISMLGLTIGGLIILQQYNWQSLIAAGGAIGVVLLSIGQALKMASETAGKISIAAVLAMAADVVAIAFSISLIAQYDWQSILAAGAALGMVATSIGLALMLIANNDNMIAGALALAIISVPLLAAGASLSLFAQYDWQSILAAGAALSLVMISVAAASIIANESVVGAAALLILSAPILAVGYSLSLIAGYDWASILIAAGALSATMILVAAAAIVASGAIVGAAAMLLLTAPILGTAVALDMLAQYDWASILIAAGILSATMGIMVALCFAAQLAIGGAIAMTVIAVDVLLLANAFTTLAQVDFNALVPNLLAMVAAMGALLLLGLAASLPPITIGLIALTGALIGIGAAAVLFGTGVNLIAEGVTKLISAFSSLVGSVTSTVGSIVSSIAGLGGSIVGIVGGWAGSFMAGGVKAITGLWTGLKSKVGAITSTVGGAMKSAYNEIATRVGSFKSKALEIGTGIWNGFKSKVEDVKSAAKLMMDGAYENVSSKVENFKTAATDAVKGFKEGFDQKIGDAKNAATKFGNGFLDAFRDVTGWNSPWATLLQAAKDGVAALTGGFEGGVPDLLSAASAVGSAIVDPIKAKLAELDGVSVDISGLQDLFKLLSIDPSSLTGSYKKSDTGIDDTTEDWDVPINHAAKQQAENLSDAIDDVAVSLGGGGGGGGAAGAAEKAESAFDKLNKTITDGVDIFSSYNNEVGGTGKELLSNMESWSGGLDGWARRIEYLAKAGIDKGLLQHLAEAGPKGVKLINQFSMMTAEEMARAGEIWAEHTEGYAEVTQRVLATYTENTQDIVSTIKDANDELTDSNTEATKQAELQLAKAQIAYENMRDSLKKTIESQIDIFSEFEKKTDLTSQDVLKNMKSQLDGIEDWSNMMQELSTKGIDEGLLAKLRDMGPQGYEYVHAFYKMSEDEISRANEYYQQSMTIADTESAKIADSFATAGYNAAMGFKNGVASENADAEAGALGQSALDSIMKTLDENSPSKETEEIGKNFVAGFVNGINDKGQNSGLETAITDLAKTALEKFKMAFTPDAFHEVGEAITTGFRESITNAVNGLASAFSSSDISTSFITVGGYVVDGIKLGVSQKISELVTTVQGLMTNVSSTITSYNQPFNTLGSTLIDQMKLGFISKEQATILAAAHIIVESKRKIDSYQNEYYKSGQKLIEKVLNGFKNVKPNVIAEANDITLQSNNTILSYLDAFLSAGEGLIEHLLTGIENKHGDILTSIDTLMLDSLSVIEDTYDTWVQMGAYIIEGLYHGIEDNRERIINQLIDLAEEAIEAAEEACEIESPSKRFYRIGKYIDLGWANGIRDYSGKVIGSSEDLAFNAIDVVTDTLSKLADIASDDMQLDPTIRPVLDLTNIRNGAGEISNLLNTDQYAARVALNGLDANNVGRNQPYIIYLNNEMTMDGAIVSRSVNKILGEAL